MTEYTKIGALWKRKSQAGEKYLSGEVEINGEKIQISVWDVEKRFENPKYPDYRIYLVSRDDKPKEEQGERQEENGEEVPF